MSSIVDSHFCSNIVKISIKFHRVKEWDELYLPIYLIAKRNKWRWETIGAAAFLFCGFVSPVFGVFFDFFGYITRWNWGKPVFGKVSLVFYLLALPLLFLGSHCLDLLEKKDRQIRQKEIGYQEEILQDQRNELTLQIAQKTNK